VRREIRDAIPTSLGIMSVNPIVAPVVALAAWTHVMWFWMYATRIPAIFAAKIKLDPNLPKGN
jgi:hypothetical protein